MVTGIFIMEKRVFLTVLKNGLVFRVM